MPKRKKKTQKLKDKTVTDLSQYRRQIEELKRKGEQNYAPKIGRQIQRIEKRIKQIA